jgi:hypothetical protein
VGKQFYWNFEWDGVELSYGRCDNPSLFQRFSERKIVKLLIHNSGSHKHISKYCGGKLFCQWIPTAYIAQWELIHYTLIKITRIRSALGRFHWPRGLRCGFAVARLLGMRFRILTEAWLSVSCECCVLSGRGLCFWLITLSEYSYPVCCVWGWPWCFDNQNLF